MPPIESNAGDGVEKEGNKKRRKSGFSRRKDRRKRSSSSPANKSETTRGKQKVNENTPVVAMEQPQSSNSPTLPFSAQQEKNADSESNKLTDNSLEDLFGLGDDQLRELLEQELPVPRENLITGEKAEQVEEDPDKVFRLPDLGDFIDNKQKSNAETQYDRVSTRRDRFIKGSDSENRKVLEGDDDESNKVDRSDREEYLRVLQLNPFADADETMFKDEYDIIPSIFGSGKLLGIPVPYLQTGHGILLIISVLAAFIYAPGNPLTEFPPEIRSFLKESLGFIYTINFALGVRAFFIAKEKKLPGIFWAAKTFLLGGIAYYEITEAKNQNAFEGKDPSDRKSTSRAKKQK